jgi:hypothetical protein
MENKNCIIRKRGQRNCHMRWPPKKLSLKFFLFFFPLGEDKQSLYTKNVLDFLI